MVDTTYFKLCGGLFFNTVLICRRARTSARETRFKGSDGLNEPAVLGGLIEVFNPSYEHPSNRSLSTNTTRYKKCAISNGAYLPFNDHAAIEAFNNSVLTNYSEPLSKMTMFCNSFLDRATRMGRVQTCVKILLDIIAADESIGIDQKFYVMPDGSPLTKKDLSSISHLFWQPFLLGVWHFIVVNRPTNDLGGRSIDDFIEKYCLREDYPYVFRAGYSVTIDNYISDNSDNSKSSSGNADELYDYSEYLIKTKNKYSEIKTLLYNEAPHKFYDFYVCNNIGRKGPNYSDHYLPANVMKLVARGTKRIILTGTGGLGKSMMMRHLLLSAIDEYETTKIVPLFIPLKNYTDDCDTILDYIFSCTSAICDIKKEQLVYSLKFGSISLLLDGLDEIRIELINKFQKRLEEFIDEYPNVIIVISSRPFQDFIGFNRFSVLEVKPFTKMQALELIDRLEFRPDEPDFKEKFRYELENNLYDSHREFCTNPLLLTIMLMTFEQFAEIPSKMHIFYREAYLALAQKHDASKGGFKRTLSSGLSVERFSDFLSEFCMRTYHDEKFEFTHEEFVKYFNSLKELKKNPTESVTAQSFLYDLLSGMCLLYYEGSKYHFTHRSFQEYFCALFFSKQKDKTLGAIGDFFESRKRRMRGDKTFSMLYDMIPDHVEEYIILPYLEKVIEKCRQQNGYWTYLLDNYKAIGYEHGETNRYYVNEPDSFLMNFIVLNLLPNRPGTEVELPFYGGFVEETICLVQFPNGNTEYVDKSELDSYDVERIDILDDEVGFMLSAIVEEILDDKDNYEDMIEALDNDNYELKSEYNAILQYYEDLKAKLIPLSDDFFDIF